MSKVSTIPSGSHKILLTAPLSSLIGGIKKSNVASAVAHTWFDNSITNQLCTQAMNITPIEAELISICIGLILAMDNKDTHQILVITDAISAARKIF